MKKWKIWKFSRQLDIYREKNQHYEKRHYGNYTKARHHLSISGHFLATFGYF